MAVVSMVVGATTPTTARVVAKVDGANATLLVADNEALAGAAEFGPVDTDAQGVAHLQATGLDPDTRYWYAVADEEVADFEQPGTFRTHPPVGEPADFTFWFASCAGASPDAPGVGDVLAANRLSNHPVFDTLRQRALDEGWLFGVHAGDLHYYDIGSGSHGITDPDLDTYRRAYDDVLAQPNQAGLYRSLPHVYLWDDHDYGPDNSDRTHTLREEAGQAYRERWPHYPLPAPAGPIFQAFQVGRVLFIGSDVRYDRDPNGDPQDGDKTMLGTAQREWLESLLGSSQAEFLVWLQPDQWTRPSGADNWSNYEHERDQLVQLLGDTGWLDRMLMLQGDRHQVNMDSGANNPWGGFPVYELAPLDSSTSNGANDTTWDVGRHADAVGGGNQRGQYGVIRIRDLGHTIEVTSRSHVGAQPVLFHQFTVPVGDEPPPPTPGDALPGGTVSPVIEWQSFDLVTGQLIADLPDLTGTVSRILGEYTSSSLSMPIPLSGPGALGDLAFQATTPGRTMIVAVVNDQPAWGGRVLRQRGGTGGTLQVPCATLEAYLRRRRVRDHTWTDADVVSVVAAGIAADAGNRDVPGLGMVGGIGLEVDAPPSGVLVDREYLRTDRTSVYDALSELMDAGLIEWTIELLWGDDTHTWVRKVLRIRDRIGVATAEPAAIFETTAQSVFSSAGSSDATYDYDVDYSDGRGATWVEAYSSGEGEDQPTSAPAIATEELAAGWPIDELHYQPDSDLTVAELNRHARHELGLRRNGARVWEIQARWNVYPRLNIDWRIGDDIAWKLTGHRHPNGVTGQGRCIGWDLDPQAGTVRPILLDPASLGG